MGRGGREIYTQSGWSVHHGKFLVQWANFAHGPSKLTAHGPQGRVIGNSQWECSFSLHQQTWRVLPYISRLVKEAMNTCPWQENVWTMKSHRISMKDLCRYFFVARKSGDCNSRTNARAWGPNFCMSSRHDALCANISPPSSQSIFLKSNDAYPSCR